MNTEPAETGATAESPQSADAPPVAPPASGDSPGAVSAGPPPAPVAASDSPSPSPAGAGNASPAASDLDPSPRIADDEADPIDVAADGGDAEAGERAGPSRRGAAFSGGGYGVDDVWQNHLIDAVPMPGCVADEDRHALEAQVAAAQRRRLLLIRHAPTASAQARATGMLRAAAAELLRREPARRPFSSKHDRPFAPQSLAHTPQWRGDRQQSLIYLFRSDDGDSLAFFNRQIEPVLHLRQTLIDNDSYLLLTVAIPDATALCEEALLADAIALWPLRESRADLPSEAPVDLRDRFDAIVTAAAALFPGLAFAEFSTLVERLAPPPPRGWERRADREPSRHERWFAGERDAVRAELHVVLRAPHRLEDVATADADVQPGMYLDTRERRVGTPGWLYEHHPSVLDEIAGRLSADYLSLHMPLPLQIGYRRLLLRLDALGVRKLDDAWITSMLRGSLGDGTLPARLRLAGDWLVEPAYAASRHRVVSAIADLLAAGESRLIGELDAAGTLGALAAQRSAPYAPVFWAKVAARAECAKALELAKNDALEVIGMLLTPSFVAPQDAIAQLAGAVENSNAAHAAWLAGTGMRRGNRPPVSVARLMMREQLRALLEYAPASWLAHGEHVVASCHRAAGTPPLRWLARDFVNALARNCDRLVDPQQPALYRHLLAAPARERFAALLAGLLRITAPAGGSADPNDVDARTSVSIMKSLALALLRHAPTQSLGESLTEVAVPWLRTLRPPQQRDVLFAARQQLASLQNERRRQFGNAVALRRVDEANVALQTLMRSWQQWARGPAREIPKTI